MKLIAIHQGLGDWINMLSALNQLSEKETILIPCGAIGNKLKNIHQLIDGMDIKLLPISSEYEIFDLIDKYQGIGCGWYSKRNCTINDFNVKSHIRAAYERIGADYDNRDKFCPLREQIKKVEQLELPEYPYAFIPEGGSTGSFIIDKRFVEIGLWYLTPPQDAMLLSYANIIENATEIHVHDTSWPWMIDRILTKGKLFFHVYARPESYLYDYNDIALKKWDYIWKAPSI